MLTTVHTIGKTPTSQRWQTHQNKVFIISSCPSVGSVLLTTWRWIWSMLLNLMLKKYVSNLLPAGPLEDLEYRAKGHSVTCMGALLQQKWTWSTTTIYWERKMSLEGWSTLAPSEFRSYLTPQLCDCLSRWPVISEKESHQSSVR